MYMLNAHFYYHAGYKVSDQYFGLAKLKAIL